MPLKGIRAPRGTNAWCLGGWTRRTWGAGSAWKSTKVLRNAHTASGTMASLCKRPWAQFSAQRHPSTWPRAQFPAQRLGPQTPEIQVRRIKYFERHFRHNFRHNGDGERCRCAGSCAQGVWWMDSCRKLCLGSYAKRFPDGDFTHCGLILGPLSEGSLAF